MSTTTSTVSLIHVIANTELFSLAPGHINLPGHMLPGAVMPVTRRDRSPVLPWSSASKWDLRHLSKGYDCDTIPVHKRAAMERRHQQVKRDRS